MVGRERPRGIGDMVLRGREGGKELREVGREGGVYLMMGGGLKQGGWFIGEWMGRRQGGGAGGCT